MTSADESHVEVAEACVRHYVEHMDKFIRLSETLHTNLVGDKRLLPLLHSTRARCKDPSHLKRKILRKIADGDATYLSLTPETLFDTVGDLVGIRLLHLHTNQIEQIHPLVLDILAEYKYTLVGDPFANAWDQEYKAIYDSLGITVEFRDSMYTSVHYVLSTDSRTPIRAEIQVRTLMEEVWGEISHKINYPETTTSVACERQLKVLARVVSTGSRLVDSIVASHQEQEISE